MVNVTPDCGCGPAPSAACLRVLVTRIAPRCRGSTKVSVTGVVPDTTTFCGAAVSWPGGVVVSTTQYWPKKTLLIVQVPVASVVQVLPVVVSSGPGAAPSSGALSVNRVNVAPARAAPVSSCLTMLIEPQLVMLTATGGTKSFSAAVNESDERHFRYADPNEVQLPGGNSVDSRSCASPKVRGSWAPSPSLSTAGIAEVLIDPAASLPPIRVLGPAISWPKCPPTTGHVIPLAVISDGDGDAGGVGVAGV